MFRRFQAGDKVIFNVVSPFGETLQARRTMSIQKCDFSLDKPGTDGRKKVAEMPIESLYTSNLLREGKRATLHETCQWMFCRRNDLRKSHSLSTMIVMSCIFERSTQHVWSSLILFGFSIIIRCCNPQRNAASSLCLIDFSVRPTNTP